MSARKINPFKNTDVLWRLRAKARTGVKSPGWTMAALTAVPPCAKPALPRVVPKLRLPTDRLLKAFEKKFPQATQEKPRYTADGQLMTRSTVFVNKQYEFIKKGHLESEAFGLAEKALQEEEALALKQLQELTAEARKLGAVPAISSLQSEDDRWERLQFWREHLRKSPYETWPLGKRASLDSWLVNNILGWEPHQARYLGKDAFKAEMSSVRSVIFADVIDPLMKDIEQGQAGDMSADDLLSFQQEKVLSEYKAMEEKLLNKRAVSWSAEEITELRSWVEKHHGLLLAGVEDLYPKVEGGAMDLERKQARLNVMQYMVFPLLRPELQGMPYLSQALAKAFLDIAKHEAQAGLKPILTGPLGKRKADYVTAENNLNDSLHKLVVKTFVSVALERPFAWALLRYVLCDLVTKASPTALENLPELKGIGTSADMAEHVDSIFNSLTDILKTLATHDDTSGLSQDIKMAYQTIYELHRIAQELLHIGQPGHHPIDAEIEGYIERHHGWIDPDLAIGEALRNHDVKVRAMFGDVSDNYRAKEAEIEKRESDILETARLDFTWASREGNQKMWEKRTGFKELDDYDEKWITTKSPEADEEYLDKLAEGINVVDIEEDRLLSGRLREQQLEELLEAKTNEMIPKGGEEIEEGEDGKWPRGEGRYRSGGGKDRYNDQLRGGRWGGEKGGDSTGSQGGGGGWRGGEGRQDRRYGQERGEGRGEGQQQQERRRFQPLQEEGNDERNDGHRGGRGGGSGGRGRGGGGWRGRGGGGYQQQQGRGEGQRDVGQGGQGAEQGKGQENRDQQQQQQYRRGGGGPGGRGGRGGYGGRGGGKGYGRGGGRDGGRSGYQKGGGEGGGGEGGGGGPNHKAPASSPAGKGGDNAPEKGD